MTDEILGMHDLTTAEQKSIGDLRGNVAAIAKQLWSVRESSRTIAPRLMKLFNELAAKYENLGGFVGFARLFDVSMPLKAGTTDAPGYRQNKTYVALDYMRRLVRQRPTRGSQGRRDPATDQLARTIATIVQVVKGDALAVIWNALASEFALSERAVARLKSRVDQVEPLIDLKAIKPVSLTASDVVHVKPQTAAASTSTPAKRKPGRPAKAHAEAA